MSVLLTLCGCEVTTYGWASSDIYNAPAVHGPAVARKVAKPCPRQSRQCGVSVAVVTTETSVGMTRRGIYHQRTHTIGTP